MQAIVSELLSSAATLVLFSFVVGVIFDRTQPGLARDCAIGLAGGLFTLFVMAFPAQSSGYLVDARTPLLIVSALFGGPAGAVVAAPLPLSIRIEQGGPVMAAGVSGILLACLIGACARLALGRLRIKFNRRAVAGVAAISPLVLLSMLATPSVVTAETIRNILLPLAVWTPLSTLFLGMLVMNEWTRARSRDAANVEREFLADADLVSAEFMEAKLQHTYRLYERYGVSTAFMLVAIDDSGELMKRCGPSQWREVYETVGRALRRSVRDCDLCAPMEQDRFGVCLPYVNADALVEVAERIQTDIAAASARTGMPLTVSVGYGHVDSANGALDLVVLAEEALIMARARTPRSAIGPRPSHGDEVVRSFPGAVFEPDRLPVAMTASTVPLASTALPAPAEKSAA
ncbi:MAG: LytS/YhcK type 5TM receptor domain-containing protein [Pseudomonadota bacterium]